MDNPIIANSWMVQKEEEDEEVGEADAQEVTSVPSTDEDKAKLDDSPLHSHQLIALYDPHSGSKDKALGTEVIRRRSSVVPMPNAGSPQELVRAALRIMQPRLPLPEPTACACTPIRLVPVTWMIDCIANYQIVPLHNPAE